MATATGPKLKADVTVMDRRGLHLRLASEITRLCHSFVSHIQLCRNDHQCADARSPLALMSLAATYGTHLQVIVEGKDADDALQKLIAFFSHPAE